MTQNYLEFEVLGPEVQCFTKMAVSIPAGKTWFDTLKKSFTDVPVGSDQGIDTSSFLEASEATTTLFGKLKNANWLDWMY